MRKLLLFFIAIIILGSNCFSQSVSKKNKNNREIFWGTSQKDFEKDNLMTNSEDENGSYNKMPKGMTLIVSVKNGKKKSIDLKEGMTKETIINLLLHNRIEFDRKKWIICEELYLVFLNNKLIGVRSKKDIVNKTAENKKKSIGKKDEIKFNDMDPDINTIIEVDKQPEIVELVAPEYPEEAKRGSITGKVILKVLIDIKGKPKCAVVIKSDSEIFNQSAINAVMKSTFTPAYKDSQVMKVWMTIPYKFSLNSN
jgi:TonB family protein